MVVPDCEVGREMLKGRSESFAEKPQMQHRIAPVNGQWLQTIDMHASDLQMTWRPLALRHAEYCFPLELVGARRIGRAEGRS